MLKSNLKPDMLNSREKISGRKKLIDIIRMLADASDKMSEFNDK
jgi:hypothetical protein